MDLRLQDSPSVSSVFGERTRGKRLLLVVHGKRVGLWVFPGGGGKGTWEPCAGREKCGDCTSEGHNPPGERRAVETEEHVRVTFVGKYKNQPEHYCYCVGLHV